MIAGKRKGLLCWLVLGVSVSSSDGFTNPSFHSRAERLQGLFAEPSSSRTFISPGTSTYSATNNTLTWSKRYEQLQDFYRAYGHSDVPKDEASSEFTGLYQFVQRQRKEYNKWKNGHENVVLMTPEKIGLLNQLDFVWDKNEVQWRSRLKELADFRQEFGHCNVQMKYGTLGQWCTKQRREYHCGKMNPSRIDRLNEIGFQWDISEHNFQESLQKLREFKDENGGQWPKVTDGSLGSWFYSRRKEYLSWCRGESTPLSEAHRSALEGIGFSPFLQNRRNSTRAEYDWDSRFQELKAFKEKYGHVRVSRGFGPLGSWVSAQRCALGPLALSQEGEVSQIKRERIARLDEVGFVWNTNTWQWNKHFEELVIYHRENGHSNVPKSSGSLGVFCEVQRVEYSKYQRNLKSNLTAQRVSRLNALSFDWDRGDTVQLERDLQWFRKLKLLKEYFAVIGHFEIPRKDPILGNWVVKQRSYYKGRLRGESNSLTDERRAALEHIGFFEKIKDRT